MNRHRLTELITQPEKVSSRESALLADMSEQYPYATAIRILQAKSQQQQADARRSLGTAALYTPNRHVLRLLMEDRLPGIATTPLDNTKQENKKEAVVSPESGKKNNKDSNNTQQPVAANDSAPSTEETEEETPNNQSSVFDELQENLRRLREQRRKAFPQSAGADIEIQKNAALPGLSETVQQIVQDHEEQKVANPRIKQQRNLIDSFLENTPNLQRRQLLQHETDDNITDLSQNLGTTPPDLATETLAQIMERQGKADKAIDIYQKLILKYPQKSAYFADCIERLKKN